MSTAPTHALLEVRGISKRFPGVQALADVSLTLGAGEVLAVIGENGAGKSTLMKILAGVLRPDAGEIFLDGQVVALTSPREAADAGIALIHQELDLAENLDAGSNVFLGREPVRGGRIDRAAIARRAGELLASIGAGFEHHAPTALLSVGQRQQVEIAKALAVDARILIMDEPTSSLSVRETADLLRIVRELRSRGVSVIYISHRLGEVRELADRVLVLRDGRHAGELHQGQIEHDAMVRMMVGRDVRLEPGGRSDLGREPLLEVRGLVTALHPGVAVDLHVMAGEMVGIAGLVGAGRTELLRALFGVDAVLAGEVYLNGRPLAQGPVAAIEAGVGLVPEDRKRQGLFLDWPVAPNVTAASLARVARHGVVQRAAEARLGEEMVKSLGIAVASPGQAAGLLSGGNQQKVVLAKWLATQPRLLLMDEPTRGIDVGARQEIYALMERLVESGVAVLFASSEMEEVLILPYRLLVMHEGCIEGELSRAERSEERVMQLATGGEVAR